MNPQTNHWKLGLFVVVTVVLGLASLATLAARSLTPNTAAYITYVDESVQGLEKGSPVKFRGVTIGSVSLIDVAPDRRHVAITCALVFESLNRLRLNGVLTQRGEEPSVPPDLRVQLASTGITGVKYILIDFFPADATPAPELPFPVGSNYIPSTPSTMKYLEDSIMHTANRLPEITDQMSAALVKVNTLLDDVNGERVPQRAVATLDKINAILDGAQKKIDGIDTKKLSADADQALGNVNATVTRANNLLAHLDGDQGLLMSVQRASNAFGEVAHNASGVGGDVSETLRAVEDASEAIRRFMDALERDPDMLLKGRSKGKR
jgi:phospholipid/cholesterol/gamma-HCH transport system substrate-binding protein